MEKVPRGRDCIFKVTLDELAIFLEQRRTLRGDLKGTYKIIYKKIHEAICWIIALDLVFSPIFFIMFQMLQLLFIIKNCSLKIRLHYITHLLIVMALFYVRKSLATLLFPCDGFSDLHSMLSNDEKLYPSLRLCLRSNHQYIVKLTFLDT